MENAIVSRKGWLNKFLGGLFDLANILFEPLVIWLARGFGFVAVLALLAIVATALQFVTPGLIFWPTVWWAFLTAHGVVQVVTGILSVLLVVVILIQTGMLYVWNKEGGLPGDSLGVLALFYAIFSVAGAYWSLRSPEPAVFWVVVPQSLLLFIGIMVVVADAPKLYEFY